MCNTTPYAGDHGGWQALVKAMTYRWSRMIGNNVKAIAAGRPVLVVFYEDLKGDPVPQLSRILQFLELPASPEAINSTLKVHARTQHRMMIVTHTQVCTQSFMFACDSVTQLHI